VIGLIGASLVFGAVFGAVLGGPMADHLGRKKLMLADMIIIAVGAATSALANGFPMLLSANFSLGWESASISNQQQLCFGSTAETQSCENDGRHDCLPISRHVVRGNHSVVAARRIAHTSLAFPACGVICSTSLPAEHDPENALRMVRQICSTINHAVIWSAQQREAETNDGNDARQNKAAKSERCRI